MPPEITLNNEYDPFARIYNRYWGADYRAEALPVVERLLLARLGGGASVLDVCCGTGQFTGEVQRRGYEIEGLDASERMIEFARVNAPGVKFTVADARDFSLGRLFDGACSVFESLNHVPDIVGLRLVFTCVRKHLRPSGSFLFDLNREDAFILYWNTTDALVEKDSVSVLRMEYDPDSREGRCDVTAFESAAPENSAAWKRSDFTLRQTCHDTDLVIEALYDTGFRDVTLHDARDSGMTGGAGYARTFFLATA